MSTRGNVIFVNYWNIENIEENRQIDYGKELVEDKEDSAILENCYKIYIHSDMYPSGALSDLQEFLQMQGARHRGTDTSYLSAWFVAYSCMNMIPYTLQMSNIDKYRNKTPNKTFSNMKKSRDWFGVGLLTGLSDWAAYTYVIVPKIAIKGERYNFKKTSFDIHIFAGALDKYLGVINSKDDIKSLENEEWWY